MAHSSYPPGWRPAPPPEVGRPHAKAWRALEAEGIRWEGQVLIVGAQDLPARLILTRERLALVANGDIALDIPREWLRPEPRLAAENGVRLSITPEGASEREAQPMMLRARDGRGAAAQLVAVLTGRPLPVEQRGTDHPHIMAEIPAWKTTVGAAPSIALPPLPDFGDEDDAPQQAWPPVEHEGVVAAHRPRPRPASPSDRPRERRPESIAAWTDRHLEAEPGPVPMAVSRTARRQGTLADGVTVADEAVPAAAATAEQRGGQRVVWALRAAILLILVGTAAYFGRDRLALDVDALRDRIPSDVQRTLGIADDEPEVAQTGQLGASTGDEGKVSDGTDGASDDTLTSAEAAAQTEEALAVGGTTSALPPTSAGDVPEDPTASQNQGGAIVPTEEPAPTDEPIATEEPVVPTEEPVVEPTAEPLPTEEPAPTQAPEPTIEPTQAPEPTAEPTIEPSAEPTVASTAEPTTEPTAEPTTEPTAEPTTEPTAEPTVEPTVAPTTAPVVAPTAEATETTTPEAPATPTVATTPEATETAEAEETPAPTPTTEPQAPSVAPETTPEQAVVADGFRYTIEGASVGETVPELPEINSVGGYGEWVVLSVYGENLADSEQVFDMGAFRLLADGQEVQVDVGNAWVSGLAGNTPAYGNTDAILWAAGEGHRFVLTFLAPPEAQTLVLEAGDQRIDLAPALENPTPLVGDEQTPAASDLLQGKVVDVIDGETILVEIDGTQIPVRYLGVDAPTGDACYAGEATKANGELVVGKAVTIERQATNTDARGNWVRDVWVANADGQPTLVSAQLVAQGAAKADISVPNTRFAGWLTQSQAQAQAADAGLWSTCGDESGRTPATTMLAMIDPARRDR
ncbi:MAG TPA: thermonuclease family protein [Thermomicrobiales bacterium]|nr:thermonuclease family protein [Thermomicrobiales bacterium]